jgi:hypothetical protein
MIKNWFCLIVGILCVVFAVTHTLHGLQTSLDVLGNSGLDVNTKTVFNYVWHIIGIENLIFGIVLIIMAFHKNKTQVKFTAWVFIVILLARWIVIILTTLIFNNWNNIIEVIIDSIAILIVSILLIIGTMVRNKNIS